MGVGVEVERRTDRVGKTFCGRSANQRRQDYARPAPQQLLTIRDFVKSTSPPQPNQSVKTVNS